MLKMNGRSRSLALAGIGTLAALAGTSISTPALSQRMACITDAELDAAVGDQVRSGSFTINTSKLREAPMCSGLTVAQAIQKIAAGAAPTPPGKKPETLPVTAKADAPAAVQALLPATTTSELLAYVGKYKSDKIKGRTFFDHPAVISALKKTGAPPAVRKNIADYHVSGPIERQGDILIENSCYPHSCDTMQYRVLINTVTGAAALCNLENGADWYFGGRAMPVNVNDNCVIKSLREAPIDVSRALSSQAVGTTRAAAPSTSLPDITSFLIFDDPKGCHSTKWADIFYAAIDRKPFRLGAAGQITFRRAGPDKDGYLSDSADINALWNGLTITRLEFQHLPDTDSTAKTLVFKDSAETVKAVLSRKGIPTGRIGEMIEVGDEMTFAITLSRRGKGASLSCGT